MNDPAAPQTTPVAGQNDQNKELAEAALTGINVNPRPPENATDPAAQSLTENPINTNPLPTGSEDTGNFAPVQIETNPVGNNPAVEITANPPAANSMPAIPVNDNTVPTIEQAQDAIGNTSTHQDEIFAQNPTAPVNSALVDNQSPAQPEGFMAKFLSIFKK